MATKLADEDRRGLTALVGADVNPYGTFRPDQRGQEVYLAVPVQVRMSSNALVLV